MDRKIHGGEASTRPARRDHRPVADELLKRPLGERGKEFCINRPRWYPV